MSRPEAGFQTLSFVLLSCDAIIGVDWSSHFTVRFWWPRPANSRGATYLCPYMSLAVRVWLPSYSDTPSVPFENAYWMGILQAVQHWLVQSPLSSVLWFRCVLTPRCDVTSILTAMILTRFDFLPSLKRELSLSDSISTNPTTGRFVIPGKNFYTRFPKWIRFKAVEFLS